VSDVIRCIEERIQQWSEYENSLERLLAWLTDAETSLKNYCLKNTLEEKQEQLEKYQVSPSPSPDATTFASQQCSFLLALPT
jgi:nesprin-1